MCMTVRSSFVVLGWPTSNPDRSARCERLLRDAANKLEAVAINKRVPEHISSFSGSILVEDR